MTELNRCNRCKSCKYCRQSVNIPAWLWNIKLELSANMSPKESRAWCRDFAMAAHKDKNFDEVRAEMLDQAFFYLYDGINQNTEEYYLDRLIEFFIDRFIALRNLPNTVEFINEIQSGKYLPGNLDFEKAIIMLRDFDMRSQGADTLANFFCKIATNIKDLYPDFINDLFISVCSILYEIGESIHVKNHELSAPHIVLAALRRVKRCSSDAPCPHCKHLAKIPHWLWELKYVFDEGFDSDTKSEGWCIEFIGAVKNCQDFEPVKNAMFIELFNSWLDKCNHKTLKKLIKTLRTALTANAKNVALLRAIKIDISYERHNLAPYARERRFDYAPDCCSVADIASDFLFDATNGLLGVSDQGAYDDVRERLLSLLNNKKLKSPSNTLAMSAPQQGSFV